MDRLVSGVYKTIHAVFGPTDVDVDPNVIMPLDAMKAYLKEDAIVKLHDYFYLTVDIGTTQAKVARMAKKIM